MTNSDLNLKDLYEYLEECVDRYNTPDFIKDDPIGIPHQYQKKQDIEITSFWVSILAWGQRKTIINKANELFELMDGAPHDFIVNHTEKERSKFLEFKHRTFQATDTLYFLEFLQKYYQQHDSLEMLFANAIPDDAQNIQPALIHFHDSFFDLPDAPKRTRKHIATPARNSSCKRLNMFLRWMVRKDNRGVDFGIWKNISPSLLMIPLDVHVERIARRFGLLKRKQRDWKAVVELTSALKKFDPDDPVKYDFALFGIGVLEKSPLK